VETKRPRLHSGTEPEPVDPEPTSGAVNAELIGPIWKLLEFQEPRGTTLVDDANKYTLELKADGTAVATADCNPGIGSYSVSGLEISLDIAFSPADCGPDSLSEKYAQSVNEAVSYMLGGELLNVGYGSSGAVMRFTKGTVISAGSTSTDAPPTAEPTEAPAEPPTAEIDAPSSAKVGDLVTFDGSRSTGLNEIVAYLWDFGDDTNANAVRIDHAYSRAGTFIVTLTVVDDQKVSGTTTTQIVIEDAEEVPPTAAITGPAVADIGEDVSFDGSSSEAGSSPIVRYDWDLGGVSAGEAGNQSTVTTSYQTPGTYHVSLTVTDANGLSGSASHEIAINAPLEGTNWVLDGALPGTEITLLLRDGQASGFAGCNTYTTDYAVSGDLIGFRPPTLTQQQCAEQIMVQEQTYLNSLVTVQRYEIAGEDLTFTTASQPLQYTARAR
jgi:heat shock protein HslJ/chitodextrinase